MYFEKFRNFLEINGLTRNIHVKYVTMKRNQVEIKVDDECV